MYNIEWFNVFNAQENAKKKKAFFSLLVNS